MLSRWKGSATANMRLRRCKTLWLEPREVAGFELERLFAGGTGVQLRMQWFARAPHLEDAVPLDEDDVLLLGRLGSDAWQDAAPLAGEHGDERLARLLEAGLLIGDAPAFAASRAAEERYRAMHWNGLASTWHAASRWQGVDAAASVREAGVDTSAGLRARHGVPPPALATRGGSAEARVPLPRADRDGFDALLDARTTCRNFDPSRALRLADLAQVLERSVGVRGRVQAADDFEVLKKTSPSGGALHPTEAYLLVRAVEGLAPGLYHYRAGDHALQPLPCEADALDRLAWLAVGGQPWFANAHALVVLAPRFERNFWKYRDHPKAYRVTILDVGHLSQTLQLAATTLGLGCFVTAAINEVDIERAFGMDGISEAPLAVCGVGVRADTMANSELDPNRAVWRG